MHQQDLPTFPDDSIDGDDDEVLIRKDVQLNRGQIKTQLIELFKDKNIFSYDLQFTLLDVRGREEEGRGTGVTREVFCLFFTELFESCTVGRLS